MARVPGTSYETLELPPNPPGNGDPCWCSSGVIYEKCHLNRHLQVPEPRWELLRQVRQLHQSQYCSHPSASSANCNGGIVRSHTVQRSGPLSSIAVNGQVYGIDTSSQPNSDGTPPFKLIGLRRASTFTGFCAKHDAEFFRVLETQPFVASKEQLFLLAYRALSKEIYAKKFAIRSIPLLRKGDVGRNPVEQVQLQKDLYLHEQALRLSLRDLESSWKDYQAAFFSSDYDRFSAYLVFANAAPDFAVSGGLYPEFDFQGRAIQNLAAPGRLDLITCTVLPLQPGGVIAFVWDSKSAKSCNVLASSLDKLPPGEVPDALVRFTFEHFENSYASPRWWEGLQERQRQRLLGRMALAASSDAVRRADCLLDDGLRTATWKVIAREWL